MDLLLSGKVIAVTGAAAGIGRACVRLLAGEGATVVGVDREPLPDEDLGGRVSAVRADLS